MLLVSILLSLPLRETNITGTKLVGDQSSKFLFLVWDNKILNFIVLSNKADSYGE